MRKMNKTIIILIVAILIAVLGCIIASQITLEKIDEKLEHWDQILEEVER